MSKDIQVLYVSDLVPGQEAQLPAILASAVKHNQANGITGMLLYAGGNFMQVLEGAPAAVHETMRRIEQDPRHRNTMVMLEEPIDERHFADWRMGFKVLGQAEAQRFPAMAPYFAFGFRADAIQGKPGDALELLKFFAARMH